jgi:carbon monoxide dehydrogenase subunit G
MIIDQKTTIDAPVDRVWDFVMDIPAVSRCVPGVEEFDRVDDDTFQGALKVKVGPVTVRLQGRIVVAERDRERLSSRLEIQATERRINSSVSATTTLSLVPTTDGRTELDIHTDASILGKLGEFGQSVMRRKADQIVAEFAKNAALEVGRR